MPGGDAQTPAKVAKWWLPPDTRHLCQGDIIDNYPVVHIPAQIDDSKPDETLQFAFEDYQCIVVTQSCDLAEGKVTLVAACPLFSMTDIEKVEPSFRNTNEKGKRKEWEKVRRGVRWPLHLMINPEAPGDMTKCLVVDFRLIYSAPVDILTKRYFSQEKTYRLQSPFLEHFSQAFARFFMRVGLPDASGIPPFDRG